ncbi:MAG: histidine kinase [Chlamydiae bacterium CG10_big_fil_rev_8_21_14_0_10_42_34]|nr:MAG: histidine kinase [Chlamydiae bacterium CG10_big_fil_rev_8_21_14_0_10_42_34]
MDWKTCFTGKKILVAEDDPLGRELMRDILGLMNCSVQFAEDGNQVIEMYQKEPFDLIFMDIRMPNKDGISATKEIRAAEKDGKRVPIIALTASILDEDKKNCVKVGVDDFISKPILLDELRQKMAKYLVK